MRKALIVLLLMILMGSATFALAAWIGEPDSTRRVCVIAATGELVDCVPATPAHHSDRWCTEDMPCWDGSAHDSRVHTDSSLSR